MDIPQLAKLDEPFYTAEQIVVPPELPEILKQFTKAAIKTQPPDLLEWACSYFRARSVGQRLPVKDRLESIPDDYDDLTLGLLKILHRELGTKNVVTLQEIEEHWTGLGLAPEKFTEIVTVGQLPGTVEWHRFVVVACGKLADDMEEIFKNFCFVLTNEPDGNDALVPYKIFKDAYTYVGHYVADIDDAVQEAFLDYMESVAEEQKGMVHPGNVTYRDAPPMQAGSRRVPKPMRRSTTDKRQKSSADGGRRDMRGSNDGYRGGSTTAHTSGGD